MRRLTAALCALTLFAHRRFCRDQKGDGSWPGERDKPLLDGERRSEHTGCHHG